MEQKNNNFGDFATLISIAGIALYILGWVYWNFFYKSLNISLSFFDLSFDEVIITTWPFMLFSLIGFIPTFLQIIGEKTETWDIITVIFIVINAILVSSYCLIKFDYFLWIMLSFYAVYITTRLIIIRKKIEVKYISVKSIRYVIVVTIYVFGLFLYGYSGNKDAESLVKNYQEDCKIILKNKDEINGKFIIHNENKTLIINELENCDKEVLIINDDEISRFITAVK